MTSRRLLLLLPIALLLAGCKTELYSHLGEQEANEMVAILLERGVAADRTLDSKDHTLSIDVEKSQFAQAVEVLRNRGYPHQKFATVPEIFPADGLVTSPIAEQARLHYAVSQELSRTLSELDGVLSARVQVVLPENDPMRQHTSPASASVFIRHTKDASMDALLPQIKTLVANSVAGVTYDHVTVVLVPVEPRIDSPAADMPTLANAAPVTNPGLMRSASADLGRWLIGILALVALGAAGGLLLTLNRQRQRDKPETV